MHDVLNEVSTLADVGHNKGITFLHWNARSLFNKLPEIYHIISDSKCELAIFSESWLTPSIADGMLQVPCYNIITQDSDLTFNRS